MGPASSTCQGLSRSSLTANRRRPGTAALGLAVSIVLAIFLGLLLVPAGQAVAATGDPPEIYFVFLGDIWKCDFSTSKAQLVVDSKGASIGDISWAANGKALSWTEQAFEKDDLTEKVIYRETVTGSGGATKQHVLKPAYGSAVSPDGAYCLYETGGSGGPRLHVFDPQANGVYNIPGEATAGTWADPGTHTLAFNRGLGDFPFNAGYWVRDLDVGLDSQFPATYTGETVDDSNVWGPQGGFESLRLALTKYVADTGAVEVVVTEGTQAVKVMEVSDADFHDYRWAWVGAGQPASDGDDATAGAGALFIETIPFGGGPSKITRADWNGTDTTPTLTPAFSRCSFGFGASLPPESPVKDMKLGDLYYKPVAFMRVNQIISGYQDGRFGPSDTLKRAQFAKMIDGALDLAVTEDAGWGFSDLGPDVPGDLYPHEYVAVAAAQMLVTGYTDGTFKPYNNVTRAQVMTTIVRAGQRFVAGGLTSVTQGWSGALSGYKDPTHGGNARLAEYNGLLAGISLAGWNPNANAKRGEVAQMLYNLMSKLGPTYQAPAG